MQQAALASTASSAHAAPEPPPAGEHDRFASLRRAYRRRWRPVDTAEELALDELVSGLWRSHQLAALEIALLGRLARGEDPGALPRLETLVRYGNRLERARRTAELELERLRGAPDAVRAAERSPGSRARSEHAAPEPGPAAARSAGRGRSEHAAPEPAAEGASSGAVAVGHTAPEPSGPVAAASDRAAPPFALPAAPAGRAELLRSASILALVAGLEAAGVVAPVLPESDPRAAAAGRA